MKTAKVAWFVLGIAWLALYWPLLIGRVPAFRDGYHFYYPLQVWLADQAQQGEIFPQANLQDGIGVNLAGEMSTGLFYPGRVLFFVPWLDTAQRMGLSLLLHTALSGAGAAYAARRMGLNATAQCLAAAAYSLSGPVGFQHVNAIYLVGAAWLPWALGECWVLAGGEVRGSTDASTSTSTIGSAGTSGEVRWVVWGVACCLMILGGDPQGAVHVGLLTCLAVGWAGWSARSLRVTLIRALQLGIATCIVAGLTAVQTLPTWHWMQTVTALNLGTEVASTALPSSCVR